MKEGGTGGSKRRGLRARWGPPRPHDVKGAGAAGKNFWGTRGEGETRAETHRIHKKSVKKPSPCLRGCERGEGSLSKKKKKKKNEEKRERSSKGRTEQLPGRRGGSAWSQGHTAQVGRHQKKGPGLATKKTRLQRQKNVLLLTGVTRQTVYTRAGRNGTCPGVKKKKKKKSRVKK